MVLPCAPANTPVHDSRTTMNSLETRATLLVRIRDSNDRRAWNDFFQLYMPLIYSYSIKHGFQDADAADIAQEVMCTVVRSICAFDYDRTKGSFRGWLLAVTRNCIRKRWEQLQRNVGTIGMTSVMEQQVADPSDDLVSQWEREYELRIFHWAAGQVRTEFTEPTWQAFWMTTVEGQSIEAAARCFGISAGAVYIARSRVLARIRSLITESRLMEDAK